MIWNLNHAHADSLRNFLRFTALVFAVPTLPSLLIFYFHRNCRGRITLAFHWPILTHLPSQLVHNASVERTKMIDITGFSAGIGLAIILRCKTTVNPY